MSNGDYKDVAALKPHSSLSDKKTTSEFVVDIQAMIDNDPSKSIRFIARDMGVSEFLIRQVVHVDIQYFSYKMINGKFLWQAMKNKRKDPAAKFFNNSWFVLSLQDLLILMKSKHPVHIMVFGVVTSDSNVISPFI